MQRESPPDRHVLRATFDDSPEAYDRARPVAPTEVFDDVVSLAGLAAGDRILEIGCGTGQATLPLAERGLQIVAVELGESLAAYARRKLSGLPGVEVVTSSFEDWDPVGVPFDAVVSFNAFHWIDSEIRYRKSAEVLRQGGALAVFGSRFLEHDDADPAWLDLQREHEALTGDRLPSMRPDEVRDRSGEFEEEGFFTDVMFRRYRWEREYDADRYVDLLATMSWYSTLDDDARRELFARIHRRIAAAPGGKIAPTTAAVLYVARRGLLPGD